MTIAAKIIADSVSPDGIRLAAVQCRYPKFIHGEVMTHRVFSRNASSSRAIPVERLIQDVIDDPALPVKWFKNKPGMQGTEEIIGAERDALIADYLAARDAAVDMARVMHSRGAHKQHVNRVIEPYCHINTLISSTHWANFFALRDHKDADPTIAALAVAVKEALAQSRPEPLAPGQWHLPYVDLKEITFTDGVMWDLGQKLSVARCARVSYLTQEGKAPDMKADLALYDRLVGSAPLHASPAEHQATPDSQVYGNWRTGGALKSYRWQNRGFHGNFNGWIQYRKTLPHENVPDHASVRAA